MRPPLVYRSQGTIRMGTNLSLARIKSSLLPPIGRSQDRQLNVGGFYSEPSLPLLLFLHPPH